MRIFLIGATGFTGSHLVDMVLEQGWELTCYVRPTSDISSYENKQFTIKYGVLEDLDALTEASKGHDVMIHLAGLSKIFVTNMIKCCKRNDIKRIIFTGSTGIFTKLDPSIKHLKLEAEELIRSSGLQYTIIRPTMIYGSYRDRNMTKLVRFLNRTKVLPVFGSGQFLQQPVYVKDLARAYVLALNTESSISKEYNISGKYPVSYNEIIDTTAKLLGKKVWKIHIPIWLSIIGVKLIGLVFKNYRFTVEQIKRLNENKNFSHEEATQDMGYHAISFQDGMIIEVQEFRVKSKL